jgi:hypothetical protein
MVYMLNLWHVLRVHARHRYDHRRHELTHSRPPFQFPPFMGNNERKEISSSSSDDDDDE